MAELRWSLLALGVLFIAGLAAWEYRKRSAGRQAAAAPEPGSTLTTESARETRTAVDPTMSFPEPSPREAVRQPQIIEIVDPGVFEEESIAADARRAPQFGELPPLRDPAMEAVERAAAWLAAGGTAAAQSPEAPLQLLWPPEGQRRIVALRVIPRLGERFAGGALRQALSGEGLEFGEFDIFHLPLPDRRVVLSAASLTKPGTFRLATMDPLAYPGLNLFAVLPGPLPAVEAFDLLLATGRALAERLRGELTDHAGNLLDAARAAERRRELLAAPGASDTWP